MTPPPMALFASLFLLVFVAELPDKTSLSMVLLATRKHPWGVFVGACAAFVIQSLIAVTAGSLLGRLNPLWIHRGAGILLIVFAIPMWLQGKSDEDLKQSDKLDQEELWRTIASSFVVIFMAEWGDATQLTTLALVARYGHPLLIFVASTLALWSVTALGVTLGHQARRFINPRLVVRVGAVLFVAAGAYVIWKA